MCVLSLIYSYVVCMWLLYSMLSGCYLFCVFCSLLCSYYFCVFYNSCCLCFLVLYVMISILCVLCFCIVLCITSPNVYKPICLLSIYGPLPLVGNRTAVNKYHVSYTWRHVPKGFSVARFILLCALMPCFKYIRFS